MGSERVPEKRRLAQLPVPTATGRTVGAQLCERDDGVHLAVKYQRDGEWVQEGFLFHGCAAFRSRSESRMTAWHVEGAYDALVEVVPSDWLAELDALYSSAIPGKPLHHYMIYVDDGGSYEFAAADWSWLPETPAP